MSPEAIDRRLRDLGQLYKLWLSLREARYIGRAEDLGVARFKRSGTSEEDRDRQDATSRQPEQRETSR